MTEKQTLYEASTIEAELYQHFTEEGYKTCFEHPEDNPAGVYLVIEKIGETSENHLFTATFAVQVYADTLANAAREAFRLMPAIKRLGNRKGIAATDVTNCYNWTDTETKEYRYQLLVDVVYYG